MLQYHESETAWVICIKKIVAMWQSIKSQDIWELVNQNGLGTVPINYFVKGLSQHAVANRSISQKKQSTIPQMSTLRLGSLFGCQTKTIRKSGQDISRAPALVDMSESI